MKKTSHKLTQKEVIDRFIKCHSDKYDYSKVIYNGAETKVKIKCKRCGKIFYQTPAKHWLGQGCKCNKNSKISTEGFIQKAKSLYGNLYNYSLCNYKNMNTKVKIKCNRCNTVFEQLPASHLRGHGCESCNRKEKALLRANTKEEALQQLETKFPNQFIYTNIPDKPLNNLLNIQCKKCGSTFKRTVNAHLFSNGCPNCNKVEISIETFLNKAKEMHNDLYEYDIANYKNAHTKIKIKCKKCGKTFIQMPEKHIRGQGCPYCNMSKGEKAVATWLKIKKINYLTQYRFPDCRYKKPLPFDFYLPDYNTCIEFQGIQHYKSIKGFGGDEAFKLLLIKDKIKAEYCNKHNIKLITIIYDEKIENKLRRIF